MARTEEMNMTEWYKLDLQATPTRESWKKLRGVRLVIYSIIPVWLLSYLDFSEPIPEGAYAMGALYLFSVALMEGLVFFGIYLVEYSATENSERITKFALYVIVPIWLLSYLDFSQPIPEAAYSVGVVYLTLLVLLDRKGVPVDALAEASTSENNSKFTERE